MTLRSVAQGKNLGSFTAKQDDDTQSKINARFERIVEQGKMDEIQRRLKRELERFK